MRGRLRTLAAGVAALCLTTAPADAASLYDGPAPRPGPDMLYEPLATSPQLENTGVWKAEPILVSGTTAYRESEFLYQDYLYDDHGARFVRDPADPSTSANTFSQPAGTYTYPTKPEYAGNAADIVELRIKALPDATAFRLTLNTLIDPELTAATIAIGDSAAPLPVPHGANATTPAQLFVTWHGTTAEITEAATGAPLNPAPAVSVDRDRRQIEIRVPHATWNPGTSKVKFAAATGLWDKANNSYLTPTGSATADRPGGAGPTPNAAAFFNVAFRTAEPLPTVSGALSDPSWWRDKQQGAELRTGNLGAFRQEVDFAKLAAGTTDNSTVPTTGPINRILVSHQETKQGIDFSVECGTPAKCEGELRGRLQPYAIYVPEKKGPKGYGLTLLLHSLGASYNQFHGTKNQSQFAERGSGSIVLTPSGRGPDGWYYDHAGADTFEAWADVAARYPLDPEYTAIAGYSMGGYGTYKFATQYPDLFAKGQPTVGPPGLGIAPADPNEPSGGPQTSTTPMLPSLRNIPFEMWNGVADELVPIAGATAHANAFDALGLRYEFKAHANADHFLLAINDQYAPAAEFLGDTKVDRDPPHVTYVRNPKMDFAGVKSVANHAYWLSNIELSNAGGNAPNGTIDVRSEGFGVGDPEPGETERGGGALSGGTLVAPIAFTSQAKRWGSAPQIPKRDRLVIEARNVKTVTINLERARVTCNAQLDVTTDSPIAVTLAGCEKGRTRFGGSAACGSKGLPRSSVSRGGLRGSRTKGIAASGRSIGFTCAKGKRKPGTVKRVQIAIARRAGKNRCQYLKSNGKLGKRRACDQPSWLTAKRRAKKGNKYPWTFKSTKRLPRGTYDLRVRTIDGTGTVERQPRKYARKTIRIR